MENKEYLISLFKEAKSKQELLFLKWKLKKFAYFKQVFDEEFVRIEISTISQENIINQLMKAYFKQDNIYAIAKSLSDKYTVALTSIINSIENMMKLYDKTSKEYIILNTIKNMIKLGIKADKRLEENEINYTVSIEILKLYINSGSSTIEEFCKTTGCTKSDIKMSLDILRERNHPLYLEYKALKDVQRKAGFSRGAIATKVTNSKEEEKVIEDLKNLPIEGIIKLFEQPNTKEFKLFCKINKISENLLISLIQNNSLLLNIIANNLEIYYKYEEYYKRLIKNVIVEIKSSNFSFYKYYLQTFIDLNTLWAISNIFNDIEGKTVIRDFFNEHKSSLEVLNSNTLQIILNSKKISYENETIILTEKEFKEALEHLKSRNMPINKATLFEVLKNKTNLEERKNEYYISFLNNANSIEELLIFKWRWYKTLTNYNFNDANSVLDSNIERIAYQNATISKESIIRDLINGSSLSEIKEKYITTARAIKEIISSYLARKDYNKEILNIKFTFHDLMCEEKQDRDFLCAVSAIKLFNEYGCYNQSSINKHFDCTSHDYTKYIKVLDSRNHPLAISYHSKRKEQFKTAISINKSQHYDQLRKEKEETIKDYKNLTANEITSILSNPSHINFGRLCLAYNLNSNILVKLLQDNPNLKSELANNKDSIKNIYNIYEMKYQILINQVVSSINNLKEDSYATPFDLYKYYSSTTLNFNFLVEIARNYNIEAAQTIEKYIRMFPNLFRRIDRRALDTLKSAKIISCCKESIAFTSKDLAQALESIKEKKLPHIKGVLHGAIKEQIELKDEKTKRKV